MDERSKKLIEEIRKERRMASDVVRVRLANQTDEPKRREVEVAEMIVRDIGAANYFELDGVCQWTVYGQPSIHRYMIAAIIDVIHAYNVWDIDSFYHPVTFAYSNKPTIRREIVFVARLKQASPG